MPFRDFCDNLNLNALRSFNSKSQLDTGTRPSRVEQGPDSLSLLLWHPILHPLCSTTIHPLGGLKNSAFLFLMVPFFILVLFSYLLLMIY